MGWMAELAAKGYPQVCGALVALEQAALRAGDDLAAAGWLAVLNELEHLDAALCDEWGGAEVVAAGAAGRRGLDPARLVELPAPGRYQPGELLDADAVDAAAAVAERLGRGGLTYVADRDRLARWVRARPGRLVELRFRGRSVIGPPARFDPDWWCRAWVPNDAEWLVTVTGDGDVFSAGVGGV